MRNKLINIQKSCMDFDFHPSTFIVVIDIWLSIVAVTAFAIISTFESCTVTLAVFLSTLRFFASASSPWNYGRNSIEVVWMPKINQLFGVINLFDIFFVVLACYTDATLIACLAFGETFTIKFQAVNLSAFTSLL